MKIESKSNLVENLKNQDYTINLGSSLRGSRVEAEVLFSDVSHLSVSKTCGCTMPRIELLPEGGFKMYIHYDSQKVGTISQKVYERVIDENAKEHLITFNLKGQII